jgi:hypothetical protein
VKATKTCQAVLLILSSVICASAYAEGVDEPNRYDSFTISGVLHRFDRKTGALEKLIIGADGVPYWANVTVRYSENAPIKKATPEKVTAENQPKVTVPKTNSENAQIGEKKSSAPRIFDDKDQDITDLVTEFDRRSSIPDISAYEKKTSLSHTVQIGERITGNILVRNLGDRRLKALELTMFVPVIGREKPEEHRFLFLDSKTGYVSPPQPSATGKEAESLLQKVDLPCPAGGVKGSPELRITHIKFAE